MAAIEVLPPEILLEIGRQVRGRYRNSDLANLSLVSRQLRPVAQESLLQKPRLKLINIHLFMVELNRHSWIIPRIQDLELWSTDEGRELKYFTLPDFPTGFFARVPQRMMNHFLTQVKYSAVPCAPDISAKLDPKECADTIKRFSKSKAHEREWNMALEQDIVPALLGLLLVNLPKLKALRCAAVWLMDFPNLTSVLSAEVSLVVPSAWKHDWLAGTMDMLAEKLEEFEVPTNDFHMRFSRNASALFNFSSFTKLKKLSISMDAIYYRDRPPLRPSPWPVPLLPPNLEILRISEGTDLTTSFVEDLCKVKKEGKILQALRRVEIFFKLQYDFVVIEPTSLKTVCSDAIIALSLYFPGYPITTREVDRSLWSLKEERMMAQVRWERFYRKHELAMSLESYEWDRLWVMERCVCELDSEQEMELNFDVDGDVEMASD
ncbi:hypothetical protein SLS60_003603 [Paraconiothyrium brasiliense]|uniref:F-box domain-containing protein n=1 Tax=Paraconiothyrium brasiliense TaxID=300254 RepID=A0ABR3RPB6_9PLEO